MGEMKMKIASEHAKFLKVNSPNLDFFDFEHEIIVHMERRGKSADGLNIQELYVTYYL
jgi:hypothetical protein